MKCRRLRLLSLSSLLLPSCAFAQAQSTYWNTFGPDRAAGAFLNITREHRTSQNAIGIATDTQQRLLVLNEWDESSTTNMDCAVTRHLRRARALDMDYTGPDELEGTRRVAADMGGSDIDNCSSIDSDGLDRAVIAGTGDTGNGLGGFLIRLTADGSYDTSFAGDGKFLLRNLAAFSGAQTRLNHVVALSNNRIVACGSVTRGGNERMLVLRVTAGGDLDVSFNGNGFRELDFNGGAADDGACARLLVLPGGDLLAGGVVADSTGVDDYALARFNSDGTSDTSFSGDGLLTLPHGSQLAATPILSDLAYDAGRDRLLFSCWLSFGANLLPAGCIVALDEDGSFDTSFANGGRFTFRYSDYVGLTAARENGGTRTRRLLVREDGMLYVLGQHDNSSNDTATHGDSDVARLRVQPDGSVGLFGASTFQSFPSVRPSFGNVSNATALATDERNDERLMDAIWYRGNIVLRVDRTRYPSNVFDHDADGNLDEPGPAVPVIAALPIDRLFSDDLEFDGVPTASNSLMPLISVPAGYGRYCSVRDPTTGSFGLLPAGPGDDPCSDLIGSNPNNRIERAGLYAQSGNNSVAGICGGFIALYIGAGTSAMSLAFNGTSGQSQCIFTNVPTEMPIFARPYTGAHVGNAQAFNHDADGIPLDVSDFGQPAGIYDACYVDNRGRQRSIGNPNANPSTCQGDGSGVDEPASDIPVTGSRFAVAMASGRVSMAVPRHVPLFTPPANDPYQREVFVRHQVGAGRYAEVFTAYYAHMQDTAVRRGQSVVAGTVLGRIGTTGASSGEHLHISVHRHRNLTYRQTFEFDFSGGNRMDRDSSVSAVDPWGWQAPAGVDPWAWRFRVNPQGDALRDDAGTFSTNLWQAGEAPTLN